jgi:hypothetical protein
MGIEIINDCNQKFKPDPIKVTNEILKRIPKKFLKGLDKIIFLEGSNTPITKYIDGSKGQGPRFKIFMGGFTKDNSFSIFHYNILFINLVVDHVVKFIQPGTMDHDILKVRQSRIPNFNWMWLGYWQPMIYLFWILNYLYSRVLLFRKLVDHRIKIFLRNGKSNR